MLIAEPERKPINLLRRMLGSIELDVFDLPNEMGKSGPWLIIPGNDEEIDFGPTFYMGAAKNITIPEDVSSIQSAVKAYDPGHNSNVIIEYLDVMANDLSHPGWIYLRNLWDNFGYLPLSTFEIWKALAKNHKALTLLLFKFEMNEEFIRRFDTEFSLLWEVIPLDYWLNSREQFKLSLENLGIDPKLVASQIKVMFEKFENSVSCYPEEMIKYLAGGELSPIYEGKQEKQILSFLVQELIREHSESAWPVHFKNELIHTAKELENICELIVYPHFRQAAVALYPVIAAAIAAEKLNFEDVFAPEAQSVFALKQLRDFEPQWFAPVYSYFISYFSK